MIQNLSTGEVNVSGFLQQTIYFEETGIYSGRSQQLGDIMGFYSVYINPLLM